MIQFSNRKYYWFLNIFFAISMLTLNAVLAQKIEAIHTTITVAEYLPSLSNNKQSLGFAGPITGTNNGIFIVAGGANFPELMPWQGGKKFYYKDVFVYTRKNQQISFKKSSQLPFNIAYAACCSSVEGIFFAGGENENGIMNSAYLLNWNNQKESIDTKILPALPFALTNASAVAINNIIYVAGGETAISVSNKLLALDLHNLNKGWQFLPNIPKAVSHAVMTVLSDGKKAKLYLIGGREKKQSGISELFKSVFEFNIQASTWSEKTSLPYSLSAATGVSFGFNDMLVFGGDDGKTFHQVELFLAAINNEKDSLKKQAIIQQKNTLQAAHPGFSKNILRFNLPTNTWTLIDSIHFDIPVTTTAVDCDGMVLIPSGEIRAGVRSPKILSVKILPN